MTTTPSTCFDARLIRFTIPNAIAIPFARSSSDRAFVYAFWSYDVCTCSMSMGSNVFSARGTGTDLYATQECIGRIGVILLNQNITDVLGTCQVNIVRITNRKCTET